MRSTLLFLFAAISASFAVPAAAATAVDLELALAVDVSGSVDEDEANLQRNGYIEAFRHPDVIHAILHGTLGRIAVVYYEWAGYGHIRIISDWTIIDSKEAALAFADSLTRIPPQTAARTAIGEAINFAVPYFDRNDIEGTRRVIDISGDGVNNWGPTAPEARDFAVAAGITINGLPIVNDRPSPFGRAQMPNLDLYYRDCVIGGPGAFIEVAGSFRDFARAVRKKLILEIAGVAPPAGRVVPASFGAGPIDPASRIGDRVAQAVPGDDRVAPPCDFGERRWRRINDF